MKMRALMAATALIASSFTPIAVPTTVAPALAEEIDLDQYCLDQLNPAPPSGFQTFADNVVPGAWTDDGPPYADLSRPLGDPEGYGTPTPSGIVFDGTYIRHGGSPNVWGGASATLTYPQTRQLFMFVVDQSRTTSFDCVTFKTVPAPGDTTQDIYPPGLQIPGSSVTEHQTVDVGPDYLITDDDFVEYGQATDVLICISPNYTTKGKPGDWRKMHGFTGSCTEASSLAGTSFIPSHNNPTTDPDITF